MIYAISMKTESGDSYLSLMSAPGKEEFADKLKELYGEELEYVYEWEVQSIYPMGEKADDSYMDAVREYMCSFFDAIQDGEI